MPKPWRDSDVRSESRSIRSVLRDSQRQVKSYVDGVSSKAFTSDATLNGVHEGYILTNTGAAGTVTLTLPAALAGMRYRILRTADYALRVDPNGTETIRGGSAGEYLQLDLGDSVELVCLTNGQWEIVASNVRAYTYG